MRRDSLRVGGVEASTFTGAFAARRQRGATRKQQIGRGHASGRNVRLTRAAAAAMTAAVAVAGFSLGHEAHAAQVTSSWVGPAAGNWNLALNWSTGMPSNGSPAGTTYLVLIDGAQAQNSTVTLNISPSIDALTITSGDQLTVGNGQTLAFTGGPVSNAGVFLIASTASFTDVSNGGASVSLAGSGVYQLQNFARLRGGGTWSNSSTMSGFGEIGIGESAIVNSGSIVASGGDLLIDPANVASAFTNSGTLTAVSGGTLRLRGVNGGALSGAGTILGNNSIVSLQEGMSVSGAILTSLGTGSIRTAAGQSASLTSVTNAGNYTGENASTTNVATSFTNSGSFALASAASFTDLTLQGGSVTFSGGGTINLQNFARIRGNSNFVNVNNTVRGSGDFGLGELNITNQAAGVISADVNGAALQIDPVAGGSLTNAGILQAAGGGILVLRGINGGSFSNTNVIQALAGSNVRLQESASITGGTVTTSGTGTVSVLAGHAAFLTDVTNAGNFAIDNASSLGIAGTITNSGSINVNSTSSNTDLSLQGGATVTLTGGGSVNMQNFTRIRGSGTLLNSNNLIHGSGELGLGESNIVNNGTISADQNNGTQSFALQIDPVNNTFGMVNNGTLQATIGGTLVLRGVNGGAFTNTGARIQAFNNSNVRLQENASITGGSLTTSGNGTVSVLGGQTAFITTLANAGNLTLDDASTIGITGTITNSGLININSGGAFTNLALQGGTTTLAGNGIVNLQNFARIRGGGTLVNSAGQTLHGTGEIAIGESAIVNNGLISADLNAGTNSAALVIDPVNVAGAFVNNGTLQATNATLILRGVNGGDFVNNNVIRSTGGNVRLQEGASISGGTLTTLGSGSISVLAGQSASITTLTNTGNIVLENSSTLAPGGTITNNGSININSAGGFTDLSLQGGTVTLDGNGTVNMQSFARIRGGGTLLNGATHTIRGTGEIGIGESAAVNNGLIAADVGAGSLQIDPVSVSNAFTNNGTLLATNGATLILRGLNGGNFVNNARVIANNASEVRLQEGADVTGGSLSTSGTGVVRVLDGQSASLNTLTNVGNVTVGNAGVLTINGTITNNGSLNVASAGGFTDFRVGGGSVTLAGNGAVNLQSFARVRGGGTLVNSASHTIRGAGEIGIGESAIVNAGLIDASVPGGALLIDPTNTANAFINTGTLRASNGSMVLRGVNGGGFTSTAGAVQVNAAGSVTAQEGANLAAGSVELNGTWNQTGSSLTTASVVRGSGSMNVSNSGVFQVNANGGPSGTSRLGAVPTASSNGKFDLTDNDLVIDYSGATPIDSVRQLIGSAYNGGAWNGTGLTSSKAASSPNAGEVGKTALGYAEATILGPTGGTFSGQTVDGTTILVKYTYGGDANMDGKVDVTDLGALATSWQTSSAWTGGDFSYNSFVDVTDLGILATNWQAGVGSPLARDSLASALVRVGLGGTSVPEPGSISVIGLAGGLFLSRFRRRQR